MRGHSCPKDGVASLAYVPRIHVFGSASKTWMPATSAGMTVNYMTEDYLNSTPSRIARRRGNTAAQASRRAMPNMWK